MRSNKCHSLHSYPLPIVWQTFTEDKAKSAIKKMKSSTMNTTNVLKSVASLLDAAASFSVTSISLLLHYLSLAHSFLRNGKAGLAYWANVDYQVAAT